LPFKVVENSPYTEILKGEKVWTPGAVVMGKK
jgi:hypothetical protein